MIANAIERVLAWGARSPWRLALTGLVFVFLVWLLVFGKLIQSFWSRPTHH